MCERMILMNKEKMIIGICMAISVTVGLIATQNANCLWGLVFILGLIPF